MEEEALRFLPEWLGAYALEVSRKKILQDSRTNRNLSLRNRIWDHEALGFLPKWLGASANK